MLTLILELKSRNIENKIITPTSMEKTDITGILFMTLPRK